MYWLAILLAATVATMQAIGKVLGLRLTFEAEDVGKILAKF